MQNVAVVLEACRQLFQHLPTLGGGDEPAQLAVLVDLEDLVAVRMEADAQHLRAQNVVHVADKVEVHVVKFLEKAVDAHHTLVVLLDIAPDERHVLSYIVEERSAEWHGEYAELILRPLQGCLPYYRRKHRHVAKSRKSYQ